MKPFCFFLLLIAQVAVADDDFKVYVNSFDRDMDTSSIESKTVQVNLGSGEYKSSVADLPSPKDMEKMFVEAGLNTEIKNLPQLERDVLYMKIKRKVSSLPSKKTAPMVEIIEQRK